MKKTILKGVLPAVSVGVFCGALIFSAIRLSFSHDKIRKVMYFPSFDTKSLCTEVRNVPRVNGKSTVESFLDELLLGATSYRYKNLFSSGTKVEFSFIRDRILYVGLSSEALAFHNDVVPLEEGVELLKKNVFKNFRGIDEVKVFAGDNVF